MNRIFSGLPRRGQRLAQHRHRSDVVGEHQHQAGVECVALFGVEALMRFDERFVEIIGRFEIGRDDERG